jgi:hypothetical protein
MNRRWIATWIVPLAAFAVVATGVGTAEAAADNAVVAINRTDGTYLPREALKIERVSGDTIDEGNGAAAVTSCHGCEAAAVAVQVLVGTGTATTVTPTNIAIAETQQCDGCVAYAGAFQFILTPHSTFHFTDAGNAEIDAIRADLQAIVNGADLQTFDDVAALDAQVQALVGTGGRLETVLRNEMRLNGGGSVSAADRTRTD